MGLNLAGSEVSGKEKQALGQSSIQSAMGVSCLLLVKQVPHFGKKMDVEEKKKLSARLHLWSVPGLVHQGLQKSSFLAVGLGMPSEHSCLHHVDSSRPGTFPCDSVKLEKNPLLKSACQGDLNAGEGGIDNNIHLWLSVRFWGRIWRALVKRNRHGWRGMFILKLLESTVLYFSSAWVPITNSFSAEFTVYLGLQHLPLQPLRCGYIP